MPRRLAALVLTACTALPVLATPRAAHAADKGAPARHTGRPAVKLDLLSLGASPLAAAREELLRRLLAQQARRVAWGAGRGAHITYRFRIDELESTVESGVLRVSCSATGWLPRGKIARSRISFGGKIADQDALIERVLEVVARGVLTRLAEMERARREK